MHDDPDSLHSAARSCVAALADNAQTFEGAIAFERTLLQLDLILGDYAPALTAPRPDDQHSLFEQAEAAINDLANHGLNALQAALLHNMLHVARETDTR